MGWISDVFSWVEEKYNNYQAKQEEKKQLIIDNFFSMDFRSFLQHCEREYESILNQIYNPSKVVTSLWSLFSKENRTLIEFSKEMGINVVDDAFSMCKKGVDWMKNYYESNFSSEMSDYEKEINFKIFERAAREKAKNAREELQKLIWNASMESNLRSKWETARRERQKTRKKR